VEDGKLAVCILCARLLQRSLVQAQQVAGVQHCLRTAPACSRVLILMQHFQACHLLTVSVLFFRVHLLLPGAW
jgi:hypothetical protein